MRKVLLAVGCWLLAASLQAQNIREELRDNLRCSASIYMAYPGPKQLHLTPAPEGKRPFYLSHYGRSGSQYLGTAKDYDTPYHILAAADSAGKLTPLGRDVLRRLDAIRRDACNRWGELTMLGGRQHRDIMKRMIHRFPEVFGPGTTVDARSTTSSPCVLSMENALIELSALLPQVKIHHNATQRDAYYLSLNALQPATEALDSAAQAAYRTFTRRHTHTDRLMQSLFNDAAYVHRIVDAAMLNDALFRVASNVQNSTVCEQLTLYDLYNDHEVYDNWRRNNAWWYATSGAYTLNSGQQLYTSQVLLRKLIADADSCLQLARPSVQLRYSNQNVVMPLLCLLDADGYGMACSDLEAIDRKGWADYKMFPMAANIQLVFYRSSPQDQDVLFKVMLNENEALLPLKSDVAPYYHWRDFRDYYLQKLNVYGKK